MCLRRAETGRWNRREMAKIKTKEETSFFHSTELASLYIMASFLSPKPIPSAYPTQSHIRATFAHLAHGDSAAFYAHVADNVSWTVMGTHLLSGHYGSKAAFLSAVSRIGAVLEGPMELKVRSVIGGEVEAWAVVEMGIEAKLLNGELDLTGRDLREDGGKLANMNDEFRYDV
jgi:hypothetical protein